MTGRAVPPILALSGPPTGIRETRGERIMSVLAVPESASGAQGEKPLVKWLNVG